MGVKGYKGFDAGMICRWMKFEVGKIYEEPKAKLCESVFHFCTNPIDVFRFYGPIDGGTIREYAEVEALGEVYTDDKGIKYCTNKIKIVRKLSLAELAEEAVKKTAQEYTSTNTVNYSVATNTGNYSFATNTGDCSVATNTGDCSAAENSGKSSFAICTGLYGKAKGSLGCYIALAEWEVQDDAKILKCFKSHMVDGKIIKPDVFYTLKNGKFVEEGKSE